MEAAERVGADRTVRIAPIAVPPRPRDVAGDVSFHPQRTPAPTELGEGEVREFLARATASDETLAASYVQGLVASGVSVERIYLGLLAPAARLMGEYWVADRCDFVDVTVALGRMQRVLRELSHLFVLSGAPTNEAGCVLLSCIPGEQHTLGLFMVAEFFVRDGWAVSVTSPLGASDLYATVRSRSFDVVGFSLACDSRIGPLKSQIERVRRCSRNRRIAVIVGGRVISEHPRLARRIGADAPAPDAETAPDLARRLIGSER